MKQARVRVEVCGEVVDIFDFNTGTSRHLSTLPDWVQDSIALLNIAGQVVEVPDVGLRWSEGIYYLTIKGDLGES